jgi:hypothetical protein
MAILPGVSALLCCACCLTLYSGGCANVSMGSSREGIGPMVTTRDQAVENCLRDLGLCRDGLDISASPVVLSEQILPCIEPSKTSRAWQMRLSNVRITVRDGNRTVTNPYIHSLEVLLSSETGRVMKIISPAPKGDASIKAFPPPQAEQQQMEQTSKTLGALPCQAPKITFAEALEKAAGGAANAKQIIAYYATMEMASPETGDISPRSVWIVHLWGLPPFAPIGGPPDSVPVAARNHLSSIIDSETGYLYFATTVPQPVSP